MTREEAIDILQHITTIIPSKDVSMDDVDTALDMAIKALEQMPEVTSTMQTGQFDYVPICESEKKSIEMAIKALENHDTFMKYAYSQGKQDALSVTTASSDEIETVYYPQVDGITPTIVAQEPCGTIHGSTYGGVSWGGTYKPQEPCEDCRNCKKWDDCECGRKGHINGTSIGYSIGECKDYEPCTDAVSRGVFEQVMWERDIAIEQLHELGYELGQKIEPCDDTISRDAVMNEVKCWIGSGEYRYAMSERFLIDRINNLPPVTQKSGKCKNCKYFEYDSVAKVDGVPLIVAHEICNKWGGCKTSEDGYCYLFEPQESEE